MNKIINTKTLLGLGGLALIASGIILKNKQKPKYEQIKKTHKENMDIINACSEDLTKEEYSNEDRENDIKLLNAKTAVDMIKTVAPAYTMIVVGGCMITNAIIRTNINNGGIRDEQ